MSDTRTVEGALRSIPTFSWCRASVIKRRIDLIKEAKRNLNKRNLNWRKGVRLISLLSVVTLERAGESDNVLGAHRN
jgi:hypothetical protein